MIKIFLYSATQIEEIDTKNITNPNNGYRTLLLASGIIAGITFLTITAYIVKRVFYKSKTQTTKYGKTQKSLTITGFLSPVTSGPNIQQASNQTNITQDTTALPLQRQNSNNGDSLKDASETQIIKHDDTGEGNGISGNLQPPFNGIQCNDTLQVTMDANSNDDQSLNKQSIFDSPETKTPILNANHATEIHNQQTQPQSQQKEDNKEGEKLIISQPLLSTQSPQDAQEIQQTQRQAPTYNQDRINAELSAPTGNSKTTHKEKRSPKDEFGKLESHFFAPQKDSQKIFSKSVTLRPLSKPLDKQVIVDASEQEQEGDTIPSAQPEGSQLLQTEKQITITTQLPAPETSLDEEGIKLLYGDKESISYYHTSYIQNTQITITVNYTISHQLFLERYQHLIENNSDNHNNKLNELINIKYKQVPSGFKKDKIKLSFLQSYINYHASYDYDQLINKLNERTRAIKKSTIRDTILKGHLNKAVEQVTKLLDVINQHHSDKISLLKIHHFLHLFSMQTPFRMPTTFVESNLPNQKRVCIQGYIDTTILSPIRCLNVILKLSDENIKNKLLKYYDKINQYTGNHYLFSTHMSVQVIGNKYILPCTTNSVFHHLLLHIVRTTTMENSIKELDVIFIDLDKAYDQFKIEHDITQYKDNLDKCITALEKIASVHFVTSAQMFDDNSIETDRVFYDENESFS